jgi:hypothetical protein
MTLNIDNKAPINNLYKYGIPLFKLGGFVSNQKSESYIVYGDYRLLEEPKLLSWLLKNISSFPIGKKFKIPYFDFEVLISHDEQEFTLSQELSEGIFNIWHKDY